MSQATPGVEGAKQPLHAGQRVLIAVLLAIMGTTVSSPWLPWPPALLWLMLAGWLLNYTLCAGYGLWIAVQSLRAEVGNRVFLEVGDPLPDELLPGYTVVLPLYREAAVAAQLMEAMCALDYPSDRLQVLCVVRPGDHETLEALCDCGIGFTHEQSFPELQAYQGRSSLSPLAEQRRHISILPLPPELPVGTKPAALNWGLKHATGEILVIYDAEEQPEPDQLRLAATALHRASPTVACVQAPIYPSNGADSWIAGLMDVEMTSWNRMSLPGYATWEKMAPLLGTSAHFRIQPLRASGGWDYYNVTEDWDLGIRLQQAGYHIALLRSQTRGSVVTSLAAFLRQRSRWIKGFLQTLFFQTRQPRHLVRSLGLWRSAAFVLRSGISVFNLKVGMASRAVPLIWLGIWLLPGHYRPLVGAVADPALGAFSLSLLAINLGIPAIGLVRARRWGLLGYVPLLPLYWFLLGVAAWRGAFELVTAPYHWDKTDHQPLTKS